MANDSRRGEQAATQLRHAAEREHGGRDGADPRGKSDADAAKAHSAVTEDKQGRPPLSRDWRDKPVDQERDKDLKQGGIEGAARTERH
ncbi:MAG: hypothetical protein JO032_06515 [Alphaproteobacteria bacterium]|nr:hypothetical protein [Alphaproteobacteria bacterium]